MHGQVLRNFSFSSKSKLLNFAPLFILPISVPWKGNAATFFSNIISNYKLKWSSSSSTVTYFWDKPSTNIIMKYLLIGANLWHSNGIKKSYFCHTFHLRPKKVFWWMGGWKVTLVSVCVHFLKLLDIQTQKWTQSLTIENFNVNF